MVSISLIQPETISRNFHDFFFSDLKFHVLPMEACCTVKFHVRIGSEFDDLDSLWNDEVLELTLL